MPWKPEEGIYMDDKYNLIYPEGSTHLDGIPKDVLKFIDPHWGKFPPQHPLIVHVVSIAFFFLWFINFTGNGCVIYIFLKVSKSNTTSQVVGEQTGIFLVSTVVTNKGNL